MPDGRARLAVALDLPDRAALLAMARRVAPEAGVLKLGLEAFVAEGPGLVRELVASGCDVFLDLKLHDIPNTVGRAAAAAVVTGAGIVNCHASGGRDMMRAFAEEGRAAAAKAGRPAPKLIAVTILTSLDSAALAVVGFSGTPREAAVRLAVLARESGLDGVVCSPEEIAAIRAACGKEFLLVVPGVRPAGAARRRPEARRDARRRDPRGRGPSRRGPPDHAVRPTPPPPRTRSRPRLQLPLHLAERASLVDPDLLVARRATGFRRTLGECDLLVEEVTKRLHELDPRERGAAEGGPAREGDRELPDEARGGTENAALAPAREAGDGTPGVRRGSRAGTGRVRALRRDAWSEGGLEGVKGLLFSRHVRPPVRERSAR